MRAMVLEAARRPLELRELPIPTPAADQPLLRVRSRGTLRAALGRLGSVQRRQPDPPEGYERARSTSAPGFQFLDVHHAEQEDVQQVERQRTAGAFAETVENHGLDTVGDGQHRENRQRPGAHGAADRQRECREDGIDNEHYDFCCGHGNSLSV